MTEGGQGAVREAEAGQGAATEAEKPGRVLMTIELEMIRKNGEEKDETRKAKALGLLSRLTDRLTFK